MERGYCRKSLRDKDLHALEHKKYNGGSWPRRFYGRAGAALFLRSGAIFILSPLPLLFADWFAMPWLWWVARDPSPLAWGIRGCIPSQSVLRFIASLAVAARGLAPGQTGQWAGLAATIM